MRPSILAEEVVLDLVPLVERASSDAEFEPEAYIKGVESSAIIREYAPCVTWQRIEMELSEFRRLRGYSNLLIDREALRAIIAEGKYKVFVAPGRLDIMSFRDLDEVEYVTVSLLKKYISRCVEIARRVWEKDNLTFTELRDDDPNLSFQSYSVRGARDLIADAEKLLHETKEIYLQDVTQLPNIHFDRHIYQPLLIEGVASNFHISPPPLNEGETEFVSDLRTYLGVHPEKLEGSELFLLRNLTRGKGVGFFDLHQAETFFPDFILWLLRPEHQMLIFIDPHGLIHAKGGFNDPKITVHRDLEALATQIQGKVAGYSLSMTSFIISTSEFQVLSKRFGDGTHTVDEFEENHVLFQSSDGEYIGKMLELALHQGKWTGP